MCFENNKDILPYFRGDGNKDLREKGSPYSGQTGRKYRENGGLGRCLGFTVSVRASIIIVIAHHR